MAPKLAKEQGWAINVGGGFHHCSGGKGGGFCVYADISLCVLYAFVWLNISRYHEHYMQPFQTQVGNLNMNFQLDFNKGIYMDYLQILQGHDN